MHIGPHKTGTTYLQFTLEAMRDRLAGHGIHFPSVWKAAPGQPSHMKLVWAFRDRNLTLIQSQIEEILAQNHRYLVISCEGLSRLNQQQIIQLRQLLGDAPVQVVYYIRRWPDRIPSLWQETVKFGFTATLPEFLADHLTRQHESELHDTFMIDKYAAVFGADRIRLVSYSHLEAEKIDLAGHFLTTFLGISDFEPSTAMRANASLPVETTELIRALNTIHVRNGGVASPALRSWFLAVGRTLVPDALHEALRASLGTMRLDETVPSLLLATGDLLARYAPSIVPPHHPDGCHQLRSIDVKYVRGDYLLKSATTNRLNELYQAYSVAQ